MGLLWKIENEIPVVQHQHQGCDEKQKHQDIQEAVALAARVRNILHISFELMWCEKVGQKYKVERKIVQDGHFFWRPQLLIRNTFKLLPGVSR